MSQMHRSEASLKTRDARKAFPKSEKNPYNVYAISSQLQN